ncbi:MAG: sigma-54 dependent transcriptional regulator [Thermodesulfobacteriota bacterium]|nr:sigma-54 dependent transcriptional regulator [Thermodesulfobacteriota bacterium]
MRKKVILVLEDDRSYLQRLERVLSDDFTVVTAADIKTAQAKITNRVDLVLSDIRLENENKGGIEFLQWVKTLYPKIPVVMMTAYGSVDLAVEAMRLGAEDFLQKPINIDNLEMVLQRVFEKERLQKEVHILRQEIQKQDSREIIGESRAIRELKEKITIAAMDSQITVLIQGESGTGKELIARAIHREGKRNRQPFIGESLKSREGDLLGSILFGHEKGSFTDAEKQYKGLFEQADGGVLFLDEIAELDKDTQTKLLRVIEEKKFYRMGGNEEVEVDIQLITATNADLFSMMNRGQFREDLYYRLMVFPITIPPLRERKEDIPPLAQHFLKKLYEHGRTTAQEISDQVIEMMMKNPWKGNVRELKNFIETAALYAGIEQQVAIMSQHCLKFSESYQYPLGPKPTIPKDGIDLPEKLAEIELSYIERALSLKNGKKKEIYRLLGYNHRDYPRRLIKRYIKKHSNLVNKFPLIKKEFNITS